MLFNEKNVSAPISHGGSVLQSDRTEIVFDQTKEEESKMPQSASRRGNSRSTLRNSGSARKTRSDSARKKTKGKIKQALPENETNMIDSAGRRPKSSSKRAGDLNFALLEKLRSKRKLNKAERKKLIELEHLEEEYIRDTEQQRQKQEAEAKKLERERQIETARLKKQIAKEKSVAFQHQSALDSIFVQHEFEVDICRVQAWHNFQWERYIKSDGTPNPCLRPEVHSFLDYFYSENTVYTTAASAAEAITRLFNLHRELNTALAIYPLGVGESDERLDFKQIRSMLENSILSSLDKFTYYLLLNAIKYADGGTGNLQFFCQTSRMVLGIWGNTSKSPRVRSFQFVDSGTLSLGFDLPKTPLPLEIAIRIVITDFDNLSPKSKTYSVKEVTRLWEFNHIGRSYFNSLSRHPFLQTKHEADGEEKGDNKNVLERQDSQKTSGNKDLASSEYDEKKLTKLLRGVSISTHHTSDDEELSNESPCDDNRGSTARNGQRKVRKSVLPLDILPQLDSLRTETEEHEVNLRCFQSWGIIMCLEALQLLAQNVRTRHWIVRTLEEKADIYRLATLADTRVQEEGEDLENVPVEMAVGDDEEEEDDDEGEWQDPTSATTATSNIDNTKKQQQYAVGFFIALQPKQVLFENPTLARWNEQKECWTTEGYYKYEYDMERNVATFRVKMFGKYTFFSNKLLHFPFQAWGMWPLSKDKVLLSILTQKINIEICVSSGTCCLYKPAFVKLQKSHSENALAIYQDNPKKDLVEMEDDELLELMNLSKNKKEQPEHGKRSEEQFWKNDWIAKLSQPLPTQEFVDLMRDLGFNIFPDNDSYMYIPPRHKSKISEELPGGGIETHYMQPKNYFTESRAYQQMAVMCTSMKFRKSRWNIKRSREEVVIQYAVIPGGEKEHGVDDVVFEQDHLNLAHISERQTRLLCMTEYDDQFNMDTKNDLADTDNKLEDVSVTSRPNVKERQGTRQKRSKRSMRWSGESSQVDNNSKEDTGIHGDLWRALCASGVRDDKEDLSKVNSGLVDTVHHLLHLIKPLSYSL